jgi:aminoglycoside 2'-N-acetyltransferase I
VRITTAHTAELSRRELAPARALLEDVFAGTFEPADWEHALGGIHALAWEEDGELIGHASVVQRRLLHGGRALRAGYVEGVGVRADRQRRGVAGGLLGALERVIRGAYDLGALGATDRAVRLYTARGWRAWTGPLSALTPDGVLPTPEEAGAIYVLPVGAELDLAGELTCDWRDGGVW